MRRYESLTLGFIVVFSHIILESDDLKVRNYKGGDDTSDHFEWMTATLHYAITKNFDVYVEGKNLTNSIVRSYLNGDRSLVWATAKPRARARAASAQATLPMVEVMRSAWPIAFEQAPKSVLRLARRVT